LRLASARGNRPAGTGSCCLGLGQNGFASIDNVVGKVARVHARELIGRRRQIVAVRGVETRALSIGAAAAVVSAPLGNKVPSRLSARTRRSGPYVVLAILTKWSSFTRLETRTKESYIYASNQVGNLLAE
jgi:hypothetical protein